MSGLRILSSRVHGILDYIVGILLLIAPEVFGFSEVGGAAVAVPRIVGGLILMQAILTRYELGLVKVLPFALHVSIDYVVGLFLAASPILFGFSGAATNVWLPHMLVGAFIFLSTLFTDPVTRYDQVDRTTPSAV